MRQPVKYQIKPLTRADKARVIEISSAIWEGDDYIPCVFDKWLVDKHSDFVGLWVDDNLIAFNRMVYLTPQDVWLEGLRKDQTSSVRGVTALLVNYHLHNIRQNPEVKSVRFSTYYSNLASIKFHEKNGFSKILQLSLKELNWQNKPLPELHPQTNFKVQISASSRDIINYVKRSEYLKRCKNFLVESWTAYPYNDNLIEDFVKRKQVLEIRQQQQVVAAAIFCIGKENQSIWLNFLDADNPELLNDLISELVVWAQQKQLECLALVIPSDWYKLDNFGFSSWEQEEDFWIYELKDW